MARGVVVAVIAVIAVSFSPYARDTHVYLGERLDLTATTATTATTGL
jgi:hypothetical protein